MQSMQTHCEQKDESIWLFILGPFIVWDPWQFFNLPNVNGCLCQNHQQPPLLQQFLHISTHSSSVSVIAL
ncbi:hypothetical protein EXN66_Car018043 [Channa argus]|uniref:Uncharacterized protein n=1 Tax=Channa argus TaxID=215402 RepID=A0A6G1QII1_CHAAH|nr:hypothetical protein EXN66_Car018043 [Channa argus]